MLEFIYWLMIGLVVYTYGGYPALLFVLSIVLKKKIHKAPIEPAVSILISAYNEEKFIAKRIENLLNMDYPKAKMEILIGSDGSTDRTNEIVAQFASQNVKLISSDTNSGKPSVLNKLAKAAQGEILVFTDSRQDFDSKAIRALVENFNDPKVGCVSGELHFRSEGTKQVGHGMGVYWNYEKFLRKRESDIGSMLGATGAIYAIRREIFSDLPEDILVDDMHLPLSIIAKGYRAIFEAEACAYDVPSEKGKQEFTRKVRTLVGNYQIYEHFKRLLIPFRSPIAFQLISHKLFRLFVPFVLIAVFFINFFLLKRLMYWVLLGAQVFFYGLAIDEALAEEREFNRESGTAVVYKKRLGYIPYVFCVLNYSALVACFRYMRGKYHVVWERAYK